MVFKSKKGYYQLLVDFKLAFNLEKFEEYYIEECLDKYPYIVGDLSDGALRLKGFSGENSNQVLRNIDKYIIDSCVFEAPYYVLRRVVSDKEFEELLNKKVEPIVTAKVEHLNLEKENFDKDTLILESSEKNTPKIILDLNRINKIKLGVLPSDLKDDKDIVEDKTVTTTVSSSAGFVPKERPNKNNFDTNKKKHFPKNNRNKRKEG